MQPTEENPVRISVLIPARNEQENIGDCLRSLLEQGTSVELIVADDSSEDDTAAIVRQIAAEKPAADHSPDCANVTLVSVPPLPAGWLGKNHALHTAVPHATGEWICFTDADTRHAPDALPALADWAETTSIDLVSLSPEQITATWWEKAVIPQVFGQLERLFPFQRVNHSADPLAAANGQYILIRREVYDRLGGHEAIRDEVLDDVELARRAKQAGYRIWFGPGDGIVRTRMYRQFRDMWQGWTKNLFLIFRRDRAAIRRAARGLALRSLLPLLAALVLFGAGILFTAVRPLAWLGLLPAAYLAGEHLRYARSFPGIPDRMCVCMMVPGAALLFLLLLNSQRRYSKKLGIKWKGRQYPTGS